MAEYSQKQNKRLLTGSDVNQAVQLSRSNGNVIPNSSLLTMLGQDQSGSTPFSDMLAQRFMANQKPAAEAEADRYASQVSGARSPEEVKSQLGDIMGADFSGVRIHTGADAVQRNDAIGAQAYTTSRDIYLGGSFDPQITAHELVHTAQQGAVASSAPVYSVPAETVQMMPKWLRAFGKKIRDFFHRKETANYNKAKNGDFSRFFRAGEKNQNSLINEKKQDILSHLNNKQALPSESKFMAQYGNNTQQMLKTINPSRSDKENQELVKKLRYSQNARNKSH